LSARFDQALQSAEEFLKGENVDEEVRAETHQEYQRRSERQPMEVILQNAGRYENDYQSARTALRVTVCGR